MVLAEFGYFGYIYVAQGGRQPVQADLLVVFPGGRARAAKGWELARRKQARLFTIAGAGRTVYRNYAGEFGPLPKNVGVLRTASSKTTFEDALAVRGAVGQRRLDSILLVTSSYHLPRAYLMLRLQFPGVPLQTLAVSRVGATGDYWLHTPAGYKLLGKELLKFWPSLAEHAWHRLIGNKMTEVPMFVGLRKLLKI